jgi:hypothetical protein
MSVAYIATMTVLAFSFLMWLGFSAVTSGVLSRVVPPPFHAQIASAVTAASVGSSLLYTFSVDGALPEASEMGLTWSPYWWINSGAYLHLSDGRGKTQQGSLPSANPWRLLYASNNPTDTDNGYHPQNLFRLVSRSSWSNVSVESQFKINDDNFSSSPNRNASNGLLHMLRYRDSGDTLYYVGIRVDGYAVIKKKYHGTYTTLATKKFYPGTYAIVNNVNLLPHGSWIAMKSEAVTNSDGSVTVRQFVKNPGETAYTKVLEAKDSSNPITGSGYVGIRTDFMDVEFDNFRAEKI